MVLYTSPIDPHVHFRGQEYTQPFIKWGFEDAQAIGLAAVIEQPNPKPNLIDAVTITNRMSLANSYRGNILHKAHIGMTTNPNQVKGALDLLTRGNGLNSDKIFYVHSTGDLGLLDRDYTRWIWKLKVAKEYKGVSIGHFESENMFKSEFDPDIPITHSLRQNSIAELTKVNEQVIDAWNAGFQGTFYVAHASSPDTIDFLNAERSGTRKPPFRIVIEATPHHALLNWRDYSLHGNRVKMNPPLRDENMQKEIYERIHQGKVDVIGTDHAPHPLDKKDSLTNPVSGIPVLPIIPFFIQKLIKDGMKPDLLKRLFFDNANELFFQGRVQARKVEAEYDPSLWNKYGYNPFSRIDGTI